jgi:hypothetical protein
MMMTLGVGSHGRELRGCGSWLLGGRGLLRVVVLREAAYAVTAGHVNGDAARVEGEGRG